MNHSKKQNTEKKQVCICSFCGRQIIGEPVYIQTKRRSELWLHPECVKAGPRSVEKG